MTGVHSRRTRRAPANPRHPALTTLPALTNSLSAPPPRIHRRAAGVRCAAARSSISPSRRAEKPQLASNKDGRGKAVAANAISPPNADAGASPSPRRVSTSTLVADIRRVFFPPRRRGVSARRPTGGLKVKRAKHEMNEHMHQRAASFSRPTLLYALAPRMSVGAAPHPPRPRPDEVEPAPPGSPRRGVAVAGGRRRHRRRRGRRSAPKLRRTRGGRWRRRRRRREG